jgi:hypothetical protein
MKWTSPPKQPAAISKAGAAALSAKSAIATVSGSKIRAIAFDGLLSSIRGLLPR